MGRGSATVARVSQPLRTITQRVLFLALIASAIGLMLVGRSDPKVFHDARIAVADATAPILGVVTEPVESAARMVDEVNGLIALHGENRRLKQQVERLQQWQAAARQLEVENRRLRELLAYNRPDAERVVSGRVIGSGGRFVRTALVNVGADRGVRKGIAAVTGEGLVGRVADVGRRSSRILLITDLNSKIPVMVQNTRARAILAGDNTPSPRLNYLSASSGLATGQRVVTSGEGGAFPAGIPVGIISQVSENGVRVQPFFDPDRMELVRLMDFGLSGILEGIPGAPQEN